MFSFGQEVWIGIGAIAVLAVIGVLWWLTYVGIQIGRGTMQLQFMSSQLNDLITCTKTHSQDLQNHRSHLQDHELRITKLEVSCETSTPKQSDTQI